MRQINGLISAVLAVLMIASLATARAADAPDPLQALLDTYVRHARLPSGVLLVSGPDGRRVVVSGVADLSTGAPVTPDTRFYVASVGKIVTAVAILQLVREGRLRLDDPVAPLLADIPDAARIANVGRATVLQLLGHSSGIPEYSDGDEVSERPDHHWTETELLHLAVGKAATNLPGDDYNYCDTNYLLLGLIAEKLDGTDLATTLTRRVLTPVGMDHASVGLLAQETNIARGYVQPENDDDAPATVDHSLLSWNALAGDGPLIATAGDLERLLFALLRDQTLLPSEVVRQMSAPSATSDEYGLGLERDDSDSGPKLGHTGSWEGFESEAWYFPQYQTVVVFLSNGNPASRAEDDDWMSDKIATLLFGRLR